MTGYSVIVNPRSPLSARRRRSPSRPPAIGERRRRCRAGRFTVILRVAGIDQLVAGAPVPPVKVFNIEAQCNATTDNFRGAGTRKCRPPRKARLCDGRHIALALFADKPVIIILGKFACSEENGGSHAQSNQNHNRHCDDELACSGILASERNRRSTETCVWNPLQLVSADPGAATGLLTRPSVTRRHMVVGPAN